MSEIQQVPIGSIDPESNVNVRLSAVQENVDLVKSSIQKNGYQTDKPIVLREHPNPESGFLYQYVEGQSRFKAASQLGLESIPAVILKLTDKEAIGRSFNENDKRGALLPSDKAHWVTWAIKENTGHGYTFEESREKAAEFLGLQIQQAMKYAAISFLPENIIEMINQKIFSIQDGESLAKLTFRQDPEKVNQLVEWLAQLPHGQPRKIAFTILDELGRIPDSIKELEEEFQNRNRSQGQQIQIEIPGEIYPDFIRYGQDKGINDPSTIAAHIITTEVGNYSRTRR